MNTLKHDGIAQLPERRKPAEVPVDADETYENGEEEAATRQQPTLLNRVDFQRRAELRNAAGE